MSHREVYMQIKRNELSGYIHEIQNKNINKKNEDNFSENNINKKSSSENKQINLNSLKSKIKNIESEASKIQTNVSEKQIQLGFLENLENVEDWRQIFLNSMKDKSINIDKTLLNDETTESYISLLHHEISAMKNELLKKEIQIQNIFSIDSDIEINYDEHNINISKELREAEKIFMNIESSSVSKLLQ